MTKSFSLFDSKTSSSWSEVTPAQLVMGQSCDFQYNSGEISTAICYCGYYFQPQAKQWKHVRSAFTKKDKSVIWESDGLCFFGM